MQLHIYQDDDILEKWNHSNTFYTCISHETRNKIANFLIKTASQVKENADEAESTIK